MAKYITQAQIKIKNLSEIFSFIISKGRTTRKEIAEKTGYSWGTVSYNVNALLEQSYIKEEKESGGVGRAVSVLVPSDSCVLIGLDVNRTELSVNAVSLDFSVLYEEKLPFGAKTQKELLDDSEDICKRAFEKMSDKKIMGIGIAFQGTVDSQRGISIRFPDIEDWQSVNIKEHFEKTFGVPVFFGHDPKCMLMAANVKEKNDDCALVRLDEGIGLGVISGGKYVCDDRRLEIGHTLCVLNGEECSCKKRGCLEAYASIRGLRKRTGKELWEIAENPEKYENELNDAAKYLAIALYNMTMLFAPQKILLAGKLSKFEPLILKTSKNFKELCADSAPELVMCPDASAALGSAIAVLYQCLSNHNI